MQPRVVRLRVFLTPGDARDVSVHDAVAYVADSAAGLTIVRLQ